MITKKNIIGIMAATSEGVIGKNNQLPWDYKEEIEHFRKTTDGHVIMMGRKTYESTPKNIFFNRESIILSRNPNFITSHGEVANSIDQLFTLLEKFGESKKIFMIGGGQIANLFLEANVISSFILTKIHNPFVGDIYLNMKHFDNWDEKIISTFPRYTIVELYPSSSGES